MVKFFPGEKQRNSLKPQLSLMLKIICKQECSVGKSGSPNPAISYCVLQKSSLTFLLLLLKMIALNYSSHIPHAATF